MAKGTYRLTIKLGPMPGKVYEIARDSVTLGRDVTNDVVVNDSEVSRRHTQITLQADGCLIEDLASTNGTFIDGQRVTQPTLLTAGQTLGVGETVTLELSFVPDPTAAQMTDQATVIPGHMPAVEADAAPESMAAEPAPAKRGPMRWIGIGCGCLTVLACAVGIPVGLFLWNAPASFWQSLGF